MLTKRCSNCKTEKEYSEYHRNKTKEDGRQGYCKPCQKEKQILKYDSRNKTQRDKRKVNWYKIFDKFGHKCYDCGIDSKYKSIYDLHHLDPILKEVSLGRIMHYNWDKIDKESDKCVLLCSNCHRIRHEKERILKYE